jgi:hypothetical protein
MLSLNCNLFNLKRGLPEPSELTINLSTAIRTLNVSRDWRTSSPHFLTALCSSPRLNIRAKRSRLRVEVILHAFSVKITSSRDLYFVTASIGTYKRGYELFKLSKHILHCVGKRRRILLDPKAFTISIDDFLYLRNH